MSFPSSDEDSDLDQPSGFVFTGFQPHRDSPQTQLTGQNEKTKLTCSDVGTPFDFEAYEEQQFDPEVSRIIENLQNEEGVSEYQPDQHDSNAQIK